MRKQEIQRNIVLAFKRYARRSDLLHFSRCRKHLELRLANHLRRSEDCEAMYIDDIADDEKVHDHVGYISDRWDCVGRIKFLLEVINRGV